MHKVCLPSKHARSHLCLTQSSSEVLAGSRPDDSYTWFASELDPFGPNWHSQPKLYQIGAGLHNMIWDVWKNATESECGKLIGGQLHPARNQAWSFLIIQYQLASRPDVFDQTLTSRSDPGQFCTVWSILSLEKQDWIRCGKSDQPYTVWPDSGCTLFLTVITGHNQNASGSDLAYLLD